MTFPHNHLMMYCVTGYRNGEKREEIFYSGRDAWIMESYLNQNGYRDVKITVN